MKTAAAATGFYFWDGDKSLREKKKAENVRRREEALAAAQQSLDDIDAMLAET